MNNITLRGIATTAPIFSHEVKGERFFEFTLKADRHSINSDFLPIIISERIMPPIIENSNLSIQGELRTYNKLVEKHSKLLTTVFVKSVEIITEDNFIHSNNVTVQGFICKPTEFRETPLGKQICDICIAVNRIAYNKSDYLHLIAWGRNAQYASTLKVGDEIKIEGRFQSREYTKNEEIRTAYEISVNSLQKIEQE